MTEHSSAGDMQATPGSTSQGLLIGRTVNREKNSLGFGNRTPAPKAPSGAPVTYSGDGHLMTIAPTGAGKGVGCVVPALLRHDGPVVTLDLKAENYIMTRRHRREIGSKVLCLDPFGAARRFAESDEQAAEEISGFNPLDLLPYLSDDRDTACRSLADMMISPDGHSVDPFWREASVGVLAALIDCYEQLPGPTRSLSAIVHDLSVEVPEAHHPGHVDPETLALSLFAHDPMLMDALDVLKLSPQQAWTIFEDAGGARFGMHPFSAKDVALAAARMTIDEMALADDKTPEQLAEAVAIRITGPGAKLADFRAGLALVCPTIAENETAVSTLWNIMRTAVLHARDRCPPGTFANDASGERVPENYPLALHRLALCPSQLARSVAAQPYTVDKTWGSILCVLRSELSQFSGRSIAHCLGGDFDLEAIRRGDDLSLYIAFPPFRVRSHPMLFRVMIEGLMSVILSRTEQPEKRTLFLLDEIAQLGRMDLLVTAKTLLRGYGVQVWSFWQDISQLSTLYPKDWRTILNNCRVIQLFGRGMGGMSSDLAQALDIMPQTLFSLAPEDMLAWIDTHVPQTLRRPVCYADPDLKDLCDPGPFGPVGSAPKAAPPVARKDTSVHDGDDGGVEASFGISFARGRGDDPEADELDLF